MLHIVSESLSEPSVLQRYLARIGNGQSLLLIEDAVLAVRRGSLAESIMDTALTQLKVFVLSEDLLVRGIAPDKLKTDIKLVDYAGFVNLVVEHERVQSW